ncbi:TRAP transporter substrate-binding protein [Dankookia sp. GCM10030260]|uniref:TRAP transporter substrate-binding protein n=1 Tax=Dankookia sp. GCM10030260 TaxID=3273390 RepID=UPI00361BDF3D
MWTSSMRTSLVNQLAIFVVSFLRTAALAVCANLTLALFAPHAGQADPRIELDVVGGLGGVQQYDTHEAPFWTRRVPEITAGQVHVQIVPFDRSGIRGQEMLQLLRLGVVSFGNVLLGLAAADEPELNAIDLPLLSPDMGALRRTVALWRPRLETLLQERYGLVLLAAYTSPPQVVFCSKAFGGLFDLAGRCIRTSSVGQSELVTALGGIPVIIPFAKIVAAMRTSVADCAITGARSGNSIGLHKVSTHLSRLGVSWGVSVFVANQAAWDSLPAERQAELRQGLASLQDEIWNATEQERQDGFDCNAGRPTCASGRPGRMTVVEEGWQDDAPRIKLLNEVVLPNWVRRCGGDCADEWNRLMAPELGIRAKAR